MTILHICSGFFDTKLYLNLVTSLEKRGVKQIIYVPLKKGRSYQYKKEYEESVKKLKDVTIVSSFIVSQYMRFHYFLKMRIIQKDIEKHIDLSKIKLIHAHFLYSDGGVAYKINEKESIPYITAIRNTDVNFFYKYFIHCRGYARKILVNSEKIIFISPSYKSFLKKPHFLINNFDNVSKSVVIPNGVDQFWFEEKNNSRVINKMIGEPIKFIFIGELSKNKNIHNTILFLEAAKNKYNLNIEFTIIGPESNYTQQILKLIRTRSWVKYLKPIYDKKKLKSKLEAADIFIMLSKKETFGLVYVEAMSVGLPILYTKGQGVDGYFSKAPVGYNIDIKNLSNETSKVSAIIENYNTISVKTKEQSKRFNWSLIAEIYKDVYAKSIKM